MAKCVLKKVVTCIAAAAVAALESFQEDCISYAKYKAGKTSDHYINGITQAARKMFRHDLGGRTVNLMTRGIENELFQSEKW